VVILWLRVHEAAARFAISKLHTDPDRLNRSTPARCLTAHQLFLTDEGTVITISCRPHSFHQRLLQQNARPVNGAGSPFGCGLLPALTAREFLQMEGSAR
jgi:hypothetical protein